jgi:hypothetical protein
MRHPHIYTAGYVSQFQSLPLQLTMDSNHNPYDYQDIQPQSDIFSELMLSGSSMDTPSLLSTPVPYASELAHLTSGSDSFINPFPNISSSGSVDVQHAQLMSGSSSIMSTNTFPSVSSSSSAVLQHASQLKANVMNLCQSSMDLVHTTSAMTITKQDFCERYPIWGSTLKIVEALATSSILDDNDIEWPTDNAGLDFHSQRAVTMVINAHFGEPHILGQLEPGTSLP